MPLFKGLAIRKSDSKYLHHDTILPGQILMSNLVKDDNLDDDGNWVVNFRISIEDVRMLYTYADFYSKHAKNLDAVLSEQDIKNNECMKSLLYVILDYKFSQE